MMGLRTILLILSVYLYLVESEVSPSEVDVIKNLRQEITTKDEEISNKKQEILEKDDEIAAKKREIEAKMEEIAELDKEIDMLQGELLIEQAAAAYDPKIHD